MRIAFVSREFEGSPHCGGIGTYVRHAGAMLAARGHDLHVITRGASRDEAVGQVRVHARQPIRWRLGM